MTNLDLIGWLWQRANLIETDIVVCEKLDAAASELERLAAELAHREKYAEQMNEVLKEIVAGANSAEEPVPETLCGPIADAERFLTRLAVEPPSAPNQITIGHLHAYIGSDGGLTVQTPSGEDYATLSLDDTRAFLQWLRAQDEPQSGGCIHCEDEH